MAETEPDFDALAGAVDEVRRLSTHLRKTKAPPELLATIADEARGLAERLAPYDHAGPYAQAHLIMPEGLGHGRETDDPNAFFPYSPIIGPLNPVAPPIDFELRGREMHAEHVFDASYCGPPTAVHGGVIALAYDELLGSLGAILDLGGFTGTLEVVYRSLTPLGRPIRMRGWIDREEGVKLFIKGTMHVDASDDGEPILCSEARGIFVRPKVSVLHDALAKSKDRSAG